MSNFLLMALIVMVSLAGVGCKSQKKLAKEKEKQEAEAKAARIEKVKQELNALLDDNNSMSLSEKERALQRIKDMNLDDVEVKALIRQVENKLADERAALEKENDRVSADSPDAKIQRLGNYFNAVANASSTSAANNSIQEALSLFTSPDALVLIIISKSGSTKDYDRPTTIQKYLNYLKDQRKNINAIDNVVFDTNGKIKELELIKK
ncbi:hypothetical protein QQ008_16785 [Fulvivirgaceae bacterium BMA10]|uniref:Uncharacterized protein n=1 Tax=Splendidivirga corallicola TaxID=3051826 RepID=A0ABT8KQL9_9BACT|nr:hypothetical protein [Fulvivirgaceae bacterium BMA10]